MTDLPALKDRSLRAFAAQTASPDTRSVIVEARRPAVPPAPRRQNRDCVTAPGELLPPRLKAAVSSTAVAGDGLLAERMGQLEAELRRLGLLDGARRNDLSGAFVVDVTPAQLCVLARLPAVQAVRANQHHRFNE